MIDQLKQRMEARSTALLFALDNRLDRILQWWLLIAGAASALRIVASAHQLPPNPSSALASYLLLVIAPFASTLLALRWFRDAGSHAQPTTRLARFGAWRALRRGEAQRHPLYGANGVMVSLLVGMMLNVPVRAIEYLVAIPPLPDAAPRWFATLHFAMTFDVVLFGCLYMIAFVAALRRVPLFPRLLVAIWLSDLAMQLFTASLVSSSDDLPAKVGSALHAMLEGNVKKTLISMALWLPYLLLSTRVNVTYRHRIPA
jgi:hypothetical protein